MLCSFGATGSQQHVLPTSFVAVNGLRLPAPVRSHLRLTCVCSQLLWLSFLCVPIRYALQACLSNGVTCRILRPWAFLGLLCAASLCYLNVKYPVGASNPFAMPDAAATGEVCCLSAGHERLQQQDVKMRSCPYWAGFTASATATSSVCLPFFTPLHAFSWSPHAAAFVGQSVVQ